MLSLNISHCLCSAAMPISSTTILINQVSRWHILLPRIESLPHWPNHFLDLQTPTIVFVVHTELMFVMNEWTFYGLLKVDINCLEKTNIYLDFKLNKYNTLTRTETNKLTSLKILLKVRKIVHRWQLRSE